MGKKEQVPARAIFVQGSLWVWSRRLAKTSLVCVCLPLFPCFPLKRHTLAIAYSAATRYRLPSTVLEPRAHMTMYVIYESIASTHYGVNTYSWGCQYGTSAVTNTYAATRTAAHGAPRAQHGARPSAMILGRGDTAKREGPLSPRSINNPPPPPL